MSDFVVHTGQRKLGHFPNHYGALVEEVLYNDGDSTHARLSDGRIGAGTCLGCSDTPCMRKTKGELTLPGLLSEFPGDPTLDVCPTDAISWDVESLVVKIDHERCIGCGLCVARCPYGAIGLDGGKLATVQTCDPDRLLQVFDVEAIHPKPARIGRIARPNAPAAAQVPLFVPRIGEHRATILIRNLFHELGPNLLTRRRGDVNVRIDAVGYTRSERVIVAEIELTDELEAPRQLLEDVAVLHGRYDLPVDEIDLVCVLLQLPNARQEYYQVVRDIEKVTGLVTTTVTIGSLLIAMWSGVTLDDPGSLSEFIASVEQLHGEPYPGCFNAIK